eukprot:m.164575 g.164575  ORF g.164575 m.164575 type:complete len:406 (+) comp12443_c0_seq1:399-1616(+)
MAGESMRLAKAHLAHTAVELAGDANAGYIDYGDYDDRRGCRPMDSSDEDEPVDIDGLDKDDDDDSSHGDRQNLHDDSMEAAYPPPPLPTSSSSFARLESELDSQFSRLKAQMYGGAEDEPSVRRAPTTDRVTGSSPGGGTKDAAHNGTQGHSAHTDASASESTPAKGHTDKTAGATPGAAADTSDFYDDLYFDSDDGEAADEDKGVDAHPAPSHTPRRRTKKRPVVSDDALFYDPDIDDDNQRWMDKQRDLRGRNPFDEFGETGNTDGGGSGEPSGAGVGSEGMSRSVAAAAAHNAKRGMVAAATSDAILNCSACMSTLCLDCQRHESYKDQFRAMFVHNCKIDRSETLVFRKKQNKRHAKKKRGPQVSPDEEYHPVVCGECSAVVAVYDHDEVYHFFDVIASLP